MPGYVWRTCNVAEFVDVAISSLLDCTYLPNTNRYLQTGVMIYRYGPKQTEIDLGKYPNILQRV